VFSSGKRIAAASAATLLAAALLGGALAVTLGGSATAASRPSATGAQPAAVTWFQLKSADFSNICLVENGTKDVIYGAGCSANHSDFWKLTASGELLNEHSGKCLSVTGTEPSVYTNTCTNNHAQLWVKQTVPVIAGGKAYSFTEYVNVHARLSLALVPSTASIAVDQVASGDTLWISQ
jgi:hypothetical protein